MLFRSTPTQGSQVSCGATCSVPFPAGASVTLTATPSTGSTVTAWSGGGCSGTGPTCTVSIAAATTVTVTFTLDRHALTVTRSGNGSGTVSAVPGPLCGLECGTLYDYGTSVVLTATPTTGSLFTGWTGACTAASGTCTVVVTEIGRAHV